MEKMELKLNRIGKIAMAAALTDEHEEEIIKEYVKKYGIDYKLAVTFVTGLTSDIKKTFVKSIIGCALQNHIVKKKGTQMHALIHAALDALDGVIHSVPVDSSLKLKVGICTDYEWIAVAVYGDSAFYPLTNHERAGMGVMHLH